MIRNIAEIIKSKSNFMKAYNEFDKSRMITTNGSISSIKRIKNYDDYFLHIELLDADFVQSIFSDIPNTDRGSLILACRDNGKVLEAYFVGRTFEIRRHEIEKEETYIKEYKSNPTYRNAEGEIKIEF